MDINHYSLILSILILLLGTTTILSIIGYFFAPKVCEKITALSYTTLLKLVGLFSTIATLGALTYQFIYLTPVCLDCWWQRIFMFPLEIIVLVSLFTKNRLNHILIGVMASLGILLSADHYSDQFEYYVLGNPNLAPCSPIPGEPLCGIAPTITFGFITIPFMAFFVFATIIWLSYLAHKKSKEFSA